MYKPNQATQQKKTQNEIIAEQIIEMRKGEWLVQTIAYYLDELDRLEEQIKRLKTEK